MHDLTKKTYFAYALQMYNNPSCTGMDEFQEDLHRLKYIKRLLHRYVRTGHISPRLLVNHIVRTTNVFRPEAVVRMLFYRVHPSAWRALKTTLDFLNLMPEEIPPVNGLSILNTDISRDKLLFKQLTTAVDDHVKTRTRH